MQTLPVIGGSADDPCQNFRGGRLHQPTRLLRHHHLRESSHAARHDRQPVGHGKKGRRPQPFRKRGHYKQVQRREVIIQIFESAEELKVLAALPTSILESRIPAQRALSDQQKAEFRVLPPQAAHGLGDDPLPFFVRKRCDVSDRKFIVPNPPTFPAGLPSRLIGKLRDFHPVEDHPHILRADSRKDGHPLDGLRNGDQSVGAPLVLAPGDQTASGSKQDTARGHAGNLQEQRGEKTHGMPVPVVRMNQVKRRLPDAGPQKQRAVQMSRIVIRQGKGFETQFPTPQIDRAVLDAGHRLPESFLLEPPH